MGVHYEWQFEAKVRRARQLVLEAETMADVAGYYGTAQDCQGIALELSRLLNESLGIRPRSKTRVIPGQLSLPE